MKLKNPKVTPQLLVSLAMLIALSIVVGKMLSITIIPKQFVFAFTFIPNSIIGMIGGPIWSAISLGIVDIIGVVTKGGDFNPLWTIMEMAQGFVYGWLLYGKVLKWENAKSWLRVTATVVAVMLIGTFIFTPLLIQMQYGAPYMAQMSYRWLKVFEIPIRIVVIMFILPYLQKIPEIRKLMGIR